MKTYLIEITRGIRAERPSEATIKFDSIKLKGGLVEAMTQQNTTDNYFIVQGDLQLEMLRLNAIQKFNIYWLTDGDGFRVMEYPHCKKWTQDYELISETIEDDGEQITNYAQIQVMVAGDNSSITNKYDGSSAMDDALADIASLHASDGWILIQEWKGNSIVVASRPSLWKNSLDGMYTPIAGYENLKGREDNDRY
jgi:hypothetical protein